MSREPLYSKYNNNVNCYNILDVYHNILSPILKLIVSIFNSYHVILAANWISSDYSPCVFVLMTYNVTCNELQMV